MNKVFSLLFILSIGFCLSSYGQEKLSFKKQFQKETYYFTKFGIYSKNGNFDIEKLESALSAISGVQRVKITTDGTFSSNVSKTCVIHSNAKLNAEDVRKVLLLLNKDLLLESVIVKSKILNITNN